MSQLQTLVHTLIRGSVVPSCCLHHQQAGLCSGRLPPTLLASLLPPATERHGSRRGWLAPSISDPCTCAVCELCVGKGGQVPGRGPLSEKTKASLHSAHPSPSPGSREAVVIILRHLLGKLQVLLLSLTPFLCRLQVLVVGFGRKPHGLDRHVVDVQAEGDALVEG